jgi:nucleoside phosphorylase
LTHPGSVDFLIVTALREETEAVANLLEEKQSKANDIIGKITREGATSKYDVALTEIAELGNINAQATTREALSRNDPRYVILTGIAAGFPEAGIMMGDVLVPYAIVPYELAKITEVVKPRPNRLLQTLYSRFGKRHDPHFKVEHRTIPTPVSYPLWHFASSLARDLPSSWTRAITAVRPDGSIHKATIHCKSNSILGSGEKVVASEYAEARKWLLTQFPGQAMGLEMESYGTLSACRVTDTPFLAIKASQDPATREKDIPDQKDRWRAYATQAAAAFTVLLIRNFELQNDALILGHTKDSRDVARIFNREAPEPRFSYLVNRSRSYSSLKAGIWDLSRRDPDILIPNDVTPAVVLHGGGGTGKTTILKSLMARLAYEDVSPVFVDLRRWSQAVKGQLMPDKRDLIDEILREGSMPRRTKTEIEQLAKELRLAMLIDGLNEVSRESRTRLLDYFRGLNSDGRCYLLISDRFGPAESLETFAHAEVERLESTFVESVFDTTFGRGSFAALNDRLKKIYSRPFFLSLALRTRRKFSE